MRMMKEESCVGALALAFAFVLCGGVAVADGGISETGETSRHPNEPAGFTKLVDMSFDRMTGGGFIVHGKNTLGSIMQDTTAPRSPGNVYRMTYTRGMHDGEGNINRLSSPSIRGGACRMYVHTWWKVSENWVGHSSGVNKLFYLSDTKHSVIVAVAGRGKEPLGVRVVTQGSLKDASFRAPGVIKRGNWHEWELLLRTPGPGRANAELSIWIDGKKVLDIAMQPRDSNREIRWTHLNLDPIWGGRHGELPEEQYHYCDHMYISYSKAGSQSSERRCLKSSRSGNLPVTMDAKTRRPNEPEGFAPIVEEEWNSFAKYNWWRHTGMEGSVETHGGRLVWIFPRGMKGGHTPGSKVSIDLRHGPYEYHRDEGVTLSKNFHGHKSSVNKFRYWHPHQSPAMIVGFFGSCDSDLTLGMNSGRLGRLRWNGDGATGTPRNYASPTMAQATVTRGVPHTIETLIYIGSPGKSDGWAKAWLNGLLVLDFRKLNFLNEGAKPHLTDVHFAPVWGGMGDTVPATQTLAIERSYISAK